MRRPEPFNFVVKKDDFLFFGGVWFLPKFEPAVFKYATSPRVGFDFIKTSAFAQFGEGSGPAMRRPEPF